MHFLSFSHLKVESLWQALGMTVPGLEREKDDNIGSAQLACHPVGLERWQLLCASDLQKAVWLSLSLWYVVEIHPHLFSVHGFHLTIAIQLFPTQTLRKEMLVVVTFVMHAVFLESAVLQVTCLRFGTIVIFFFQSLYHIAWVLVSLSKPSVVFFSHQSAGFF